MKTRKNMKSFFAVLSASLLLALISPKVLAKQSNEHFIQLWQSSSNQLILDSGNYIISGNVGISDVTITYTGGSTLSDGGGNYSISIPAGWSGTVTPTKISWVFDPLSRTYSNVQSDQLDQNYNYSISFPVAFNKLLPLNGNLGSSNVTLSWEPSGNAALYEYCYDTINDNACSEWQSNGTATSVMLTGLDSGTTYYWQVRASNLLGIKYANDGAFWNFSVDTRFLTFCQNTDWSCENADFIIQPASNVNIYPGERASMDLDSQGALHVAYLERDYINRRWYFYLKYAFWDGAKWNVQTIDEVGNWNVSPSIKIDSNDIAHVIYFKNYQLKYASWNGSGWNISDVSNESGKYASMDLDNDNNAHIVYCNGSNLRYAVWAENTWNIQTINANASCGGDFGDETTLVVDGNNHPHILFKENSIDHLNGVDYDYWDGSNWVHQILGTGSWASMQSLALDKNNIPHVIYFDLVDYSLRYVSWIGNAWEYLTIISYGSSAQSPYLYSGRLVFDKANRPFLSFLSTAGFLGYAQWNGNSWEFKKLDSASVTGISYSPLVIDEYDRVSICYPTTYYDGPNLVSALKCAWNEAPVTAWMLRAPMSIARNSPAVAAVNNKIYVIGGRSFSNVGVIENSVEEYNPFTNTWTVKAPKPTRVSDTGAAVINNKIYVPGGYNYDKTQSVVEVYDPAIDSWSSVAPLPVAISGHVVATVNNKLYVISGNYLNTCYVYDPQLNNWSTCAPMTYNRYGAAAGVVNDKIYVVGGLGNWGNINYVEEFDPISNSWTTKAPLLNARSFHAAVGNGNFLYVCGGDFEGFDVQKSCEKYDSITNSWSIFDHLNTDRQRLAMVGANDRIYAEGGGLSTINEMAYLNAITISGNAGIGGAIVSSYIDGTQKNVTANKNGDYSFKVFSGWSGTVIPAKEGYIFSPTSRIYTSITENRISQNYIATICSTVDINIGAVPMGSYCLASGQSARQSYTANNGPVKVASTNNTNIIAAERVNYFIGSTVTSYAEMMGLPNSRLDTTYWFPWYKNDSQINTQLRIGNVSGNEAHVHIYIAGAEVTGSPYTLTSTGDTQSVRLSYVANGGPVKIISDHKIVAAERVNYFVGSTVTSYAEMMGLPNSQLDKNYWFPWYKNDSQINTQLRIGNVSSSDAHVHVYIAGAEVTGSPYTLTTTGDTQSVRLSYTANNGPVKIVSDQNIVAAERVNYFVGSAVTSYSEMMGLPNSQLDNTYWFPWYKNDSQINTQLRIGNVSSRDAHVHVYIGVAEMTGSPYTLTTTGDTQSMRLSYTANDGPVKIVSDQNIVAAERVNYFVGSTVASYSEMMGLPNFQLDSTYWFPWYKNDSQINTQLRFGVP